MPSLSDDDHLAKSALKFPLGDDRARADCTGLYRREIISRRADCSARANASTATPCPPPQYEGRDLRHLFTSVGMHRSVELICCDLFALFPPACMSCIYRRQAGVHPQSLIIDSFESNPSSSFFGALAFRRFPRFLGRVRWRVDFRGGRIGFVMCPDACVFATKLGSLRQSSSFLDNRRVVCQGPFPFHPSRRHDRSSYYHSRNLRSRNRTLEPVWARKQARRRHASTPNREPFALATLRSQPPGTMGAQKQRGRPAREVEAQMWLCVDHEPLPSLFNLPRIA